MILFINNGRLGNQLFHFAFLQKIAKRNEPMVLFGMGMLYECFDFDKRHIYHLDNIFVQRVVSCLVLWPLCRLRVLSVIGIRRTTDGMSTRETMTREGLLSWIRVVKADFYQSEAFFDASIVDSVKIKRAYKKVAQEFVSSLPKDACKVFIHVRRGDYTDETYLGEKGYSLPSTYYDKAIARMKAELPTPFFIVLTDDKPFCCRCFSTLSPMVISDHPMAVDFAIMTLCEAGIIANSSFSWWGAYYMKSRKKVISPKYWLGWMQKVESHPFIHASFFEVIEVD